MKKLSPLTIALISVAALLILFILCGLNNKLEITNYTFTTSRVAAPIKIAQISDLHSCGYGENMEDLIAAVDAQKPDIVALTGDIFDEDMPTDNAFTFLADIAAKYPCYYVPGNHETWMDSADFDDILAKLEELGICVLYDEYRLLTLGDSTLCIAGIGADHVSSRLNLLSESLPEGYYTILLAHYPQYIGDYESFGADLILTGHAHGGQIRMPWGGQGLVAPDQGLFPKYTEGSFDLGSATLIVSRGLAKESTPLVPRLYNRPEMVIITLSPN